MDMVNFYGQADKEPPIINVVDQTPRISQAGLKSDNLQYNTLGYWVDGLMDQASDGPIISLIDWK